MILLVAVVIGLVLGLIRAWINKVPYAVIELRYPGLVILAFIPQFIAFVWPATRSNLPDQLVSILLVSSQIILLAFSIFNIKKTSFWPMITGLAMNFAVIVLNGGWMPISPEIVQRLLPNAPAGTWAVGSRLRYGKDIVLQVADTRLWFLSDRFMLPNWIHYGVAFSLGDVFMSVGVAWMLWSLGRKPEKQQKENKNE